MLRSGFTRARTLFFQGRRRFLLYTERAHFYHRFRLRGVRDVFFYSVPEHAEYFSEIAGLMEGGQGEGGLVRTLFTKWDALQMRRIVGVS